MAIFRTVKLIHQARRLLLTTMIAIAMAFVARAASSQGIYDATWGADFSKCEGARDPVHFKAESADDDRIEANGIISCIDDGDAFVYSVEYINFKLATNSKWQSTHLEWFGAGAQREGADGQNEWIYDEVRPIKVEISPTVKRVSIANLSFRITKSVLAKARGFDFYVVGGGIFWTIKLSERLDQAEYDNPPFGNALSSAPSKEKAQLKVNKEPPPGASSLKADVIPSQRSDWGQNFPICSGVKSPVPFKAASLVNDNLQANGIITCVDDGDALIYAIDYMNFSLAPTSKWPSAHLEWYGAGAQRSQLNGQSDWIYDEAKPIKVDINAEVKHVSITGISFRVPKSVLLQARGFGFYVVGGGLFWSIFLL
jgi:hypothetical protein